MEVCQQLEESTARNGDVMSPCKKGDFISEKSPLQLWHVFILSTFTSRDMEELPATCNALTKT